MDGFPPLPSDPEELMRTITAAFVEGDLRPLLASVHKEIVWKAASPNTNLFRFAGMHQRREGVMDVATRIGMDYAFRSFEAREIVAKGDVVWGLFDVEADFVFPNGRPGPKPIRMDVAIRWRLKDGKIVEHQAFFDTDSLLTQRGEL